jgi:T-complex protein 1 subunit delta
MLVELSSSQAAVAGDNTTTVAVLTGSVLHRAQTLLSVGAHPTAAANALHRLATPANQVLHEMAIPVELSDRDSLVKSASTALNSKVVSQYSRALSPLAVDAALSMVDLVHPDLRDKKLARHCGRH